MTPIIDVIPLLEVIISLVIVFAVIALTCWAFGCFKSEPMSIEPESTQEVSKETPKEAEKEPQKILHPAEPVKSTAKTTYEITNEWFQHKDGEYYQLIKSSSGAMFFLYNKKRVYLNPSQREDSVIFD